MLRVGAPPDYEAALLAAYEMIRVVVRSTAYWFESVCCGGIACCSPPEASGQFFSYRIYGIIVARNL